VLRHYAGSNGHPRYRVSSIDQFFTGSRARTRLKFTQEHTGLIPLGGWLGACRTGCMVS
jgi:hypothetical protein